MNFKKYMKKYGKYIITVILGLFVISTLFWVPYIKLSGGDVDLLLNSEYQEPGYSAYMFTKNITDKVNISNNIDNTKIGTYDVYYSIDFLFPHTKTRKVKVIETELPVISLTGSEDATVCPNKKYIEEGYNAIDNYDGDITDKVELQIGDNGIVYKVSDECGNTATKIRNIRYIDEQPPVITLNGYINPIVYVGDKYIEQGYTATDECLGDITDKVTITGDVDYSKAGIYTLTYTVTDGYNTTSVERKIHVQNKSIVAPGTGTVYLTFDDGPNSEYTPIILNALKKYNAHATFFVVPKGSTSNDLIKREYDEGNSIGIHSYSHVYKYVYASDQALYDDINKVNEVIKNVTGSYSYLYRYPGGSSNTVSKNYSVGIISRTSVQLHNMGFHYFDWNISSGDAAGVTPSSATIASNVINSLSKNRDNVVLMHDIKHNTAYAVEQILQYGTNNGYRFEAITMSTPEVHHHIAN